MTWSGATATQLSQRADGIDHTGIVRVASVQPQGMTKAPICRKKHSGRGTDTLVQCLTVQRERVDMIGQLKPQKVAALRLRYPCACRKVLQHLVAHSPQIAGERHPKLP